MITIYIPPNTNSLKHYTNKEYKKIKIMYIPLKRLSQFCRIHSGAEHLGLHRVASWFQSILRCVHFLSGAASPSCGWLALDLEEGVTIEQDNDSDENSQRKGVHALLQVILAHGSIRLGIGIGIGSIYGRAGLDFTINTGLNGEVVFVLEFRQVAFLAETPCQMMVMGDVNHVGEKGDQDIVDDVDNVGLSTSDIDPADEEENPGKSEQGHQSGIYSDEETKGYERWISKSQEGLASKRETHGGERIGQNPSFLWSSVSLICEAMVKVRSMPGRISTASGFVSMRSWAMMEEGLIEGALRVLDVSEGRKSSHLGVCRTNVDQIGFIFICPGSSTRPSSRASFLDIVLMLWLSSEGLEGGNAGSFP
ncbi:hypothetical protein KCU81_g627, partial [Aureobasidium melanogenum]